jgi:hypothetical protein
MPPQPYRGIMSIDTWQVEYSIKHETGDPTHEIESHGTEFIGVPNWVTDADSEYSDEHGVYDEHGDKIDVDDSYDEDNSPLTAYLREQLEERRPGATLGGFEHINDEDVEEAKRMVI